MFVISRAISTFAVKQLATVDYAIANRVTEDVAEIVNWAYVHDAPWIATYAVTMLQTFDDIGSLLISFVVWLVVHTQ